MVTVKNPFLVSFLDDMNDVGLIVWFLSAFISSLIALFLGGVLQYVFWMIAVNMAFAGLVTVWWRYRRMIQLIRGVNSLGGFRD